MVNMDKYNLVINSSDYYQRFTSLNDQSYLMNNTNIPAGQYKCRWSYKSGVEATGAFNVYPTIYLIRYMNTLSIKKLSFERVATIIYLIL